MTPLCGFDVCYKRKGRGGSLLFTQSFAFACAGKDVPETCTVVQLWKVAALGELSDEDSF